MAIYQSKIKTKDGRSWFFRIKYKNIYGITKDYTSTKYKLKREAEEAEAKYRLELHLNTAVDTTKTFNQLFDEYQEKMKLELKPQTLRKNEYQYDHLRDAIGNLTIQKLTTQVFNQLKNEFIKQGLSIPYSNKILSLINRLIDYSLKFYGVGSTVPQVCGIIKSNNNIKKEMVFFTFEEYTKYDSVITEHLWHTFFELLYYMGVRQGEAQALTWKDIDFSKNELKINKTLTTKIKGEKWTISTPKTKNSNRVLPLPNILINDLKALKTGYINMKGFSDDWFVFGGVRPLPETTIQKRKNAYCKQANVKQIRIHDFRHSCASLLIHEGATIALVSKYLGHGSISITLNTYTHLYKSELKSMTDILNNLK